MIKLTHGKFICDNRIYSAGDILPDVRCVNELISRGLAKVIDPPQKKAKAVKTPPADNSGAVSQNDQVNS